MEICRSGSISKNRQLTNLNKCGKFHACIRNSTILALSRLAKKHWRYYNVRMKSMIKNRLMVNHSTLCRSIKYDYTNILTWTILKKTQILNGCETFAFKYISKNDNYRYYRLHKPDTPKHFGRKNVSAQHPSRAHDSFTLTTDLLPVVYEATNHCERESIP